MHFEVQKMNRCLTASVVLEL